MINLSLARLKSSFSRLLQKEDRVFSCRIVDGSLLNSLLVWSWNVPFIIEGVSFSSLLLRSMRPVVFISNLLIVGQFSWWMALYASFMQLKTRLSSTGSHLSFRISLVETYLPKTKLAAAFCSRCSLLTCAFVKGEKTWSLKSIFDSIKHSASCFRSLNVVKFFSFFKTEIL